MAYSNDEVSELMKKISTLEWDIAHIEDGSIKSRKIDLLKSYKVKLKNLRG